LLIVFYVAFHRERQVARTRYSIAHIQPDVLAHILSVLFQKQSFATMFQRESCKLSPTASPFKSYRTSTLHPYLLPLSLASLCAQQSCQQGHCVCIQVVKISSPVKKTWITPAFPTAFPAVIQQMTSISVAKLLKI
jgi:hypothetical protein